MSLIATRAQRVVEERGLRSSAASESSFTVLTNTDKGYFEVHRKGCADLKRGHSLRYDGRYDTTASSPVDAALDEDVRAMGYNERHVYVSPCAK